MRLILVMLFSFVLLFAKDISEKMIISGDTNSTKIHMDLLKLKMLFIENAQTRALQEKYKLNLQIETLGGNTMVVIKPIQSLALKNELLHLLSPYFPHIFSIEEHQKEMKVLVSMKENKIIKISPMHQINIWIEEVGIGLEWIALFFLSLIGLVLSLSSRKRMASLETIQKDLILKQEEIEIEIKNLGATRV